MMDRILTVSEITRPLKMDSDSVSLINVDLHSSLEIVKSVTVTDVEF